MTMDINFERTWSCELAFDITDAPLRIGLELAALEHPRAAGWAAQSFEPKDKDPGQPAQLHLLWHESGLKQWPERSGLFPAPMPVAECEPFIRTWLKGTEYGPTPRYGESLYKGWRVHNKFSPSTYVMVTIEPRWIEVHK